MEYKVLVSINVPSLETKFDVYIPVNRKVYNVINMFKRYGPVGTRDKHTLNLMNKLGVDSYFSGCMTLTLERFDNVKKEDYIVVVGLKKEEIDYIKSKTDRKVIEFIQDVPKCSFSDESWDERKNRVEDTLKLYQGAHMVITSKLHCSLPCLALGTSVLLLFDGSVPENTDRIGTFLPYLNHIDRKSFLSSNINFEKPKGNSKKYFKIRQDLIDRCTKFINQDDCLDFSQLPDVAIYKSLIDRSNVQKKVILKFLYELCDTYEKECLKSSMMYDEFNQDRKSVV